MKKSLGVAVITGGSGGIGAAAARRFQESEPARILVTSAALTGANFGAVMDIDLQAHDKTWRVNCHGTLHACRSFGRQMIASGRGSIVTVGSIHGWPHANAFASLQPWPSRGCAIDSVVGCGTGSLLHPRQQRRTHLRQHRAHAK